MGGTLWPRGGGGIGITPLSGVAPASRSTGCESPGSVHGGRGRRWRGGARVGGVAAGRSGSLGLAESGRGRFHLRRSGGASRGVAAVAAAVGRSGPAGRSWWGRPHAVAAAAAVRAVACAAYTCSIDVVRGVAAPRSPPPARLLVCPAVRGHVLFRRGGPCCSRLGDCAGLAGRASRAGQ